MTRTTPPPQIEAERSRRGVLSRRSVLAAGAAAYGGWLLTPGARAEAHAAAVADDRPYIDCHVHVWTPDTQRYPLAPGWRRAQMAPPSFTPEELFAHCRPCGVGRVVLIQMSFYGFDNSYMLHAMRTHRGVFSGVAVIDEAAEAPADEMRRLARHGVRGFRIYPRNHPSANWLDGPGMAAMWRCGAEDNLAMCCLIDAWDLPALDRMCQKFPQTPVVIDHFARIGVDGQIRDADVAQLCRLARHPRTYLKVSAFYALGAKKPPYLDLAPMIRRVYEAYGPQRLMWGSDCPYQVDEHRYADSIDLVRQRLDFLSDEDRAWLLTKTAEKVYFA